MDKQSPLTRIIAAGLPLLVIALVFGGIGYAIKDAGQKPIPELPPAEVRTTGARGAIQSVSNGQLTIVTDDGATLTYQLAPNATVEALRPTTFDALKVGDWLNGGAVPHAQSLFALEGLVLIPDPVVSP